MQLYFYALIGVLASLNVFLFIKLRKKTKKVKRSDVEELAKALDDFSKSSHAMVRIVRVDPSSVYEWRG